MMSDSAEIKKRFDGCIEFFRQEIAKLRTGRASPSLVEHITVEAYGARTPLQHLATITTPDPRTIVVQPWDRTILKDIEKAISTSDMNITPSSDGVAIRLTMPPLSEENRRNLVKFLHQRAEQCRVALRQHREHIRETIVREEKEKMISEDEKFKRLKQLDDLMKDYMEKVQTVTTHKEGEIMMV